MGLEEVPKSNKETNAMAKVVDKLLLQSVFLLLVKQLVALNYNGTRMDTVAPWPGLVTTCSVAPMMAARAIRLV